MYIRFDFLAYLEIILVRRGCLYFLTAIMTCFTYISVCQAYYDPNDDTFVPFVSSKLYYDSNLLRMSDHANTQALLGKTDTSEFQKTVTAGFNLKKHFNDQQFLVNGNVNQNFFQNFDNLNYTGWDNLAEWDWQATHNLSGKAGYSNAETLSSFNQLNGLFNNLRNDQRYFANAAYMFHPSGRITVGFNRNEGAFDAANRSTSNLTTNAADVHLQYINALRSTLGVRFQITDGQYPQRRLNPISMLDTGFTRYHSTLTWKWDLDARFRLAGYAGYMQQVSNHYSARDFNALVAELSTTWLYSEKLSLEMKATRDVQPTQTLIASFMVSTGVEVIPVWNPTPKISVQLPLKYMHQDYLGEIASNVNAVQQQTNDTGAVGLNLTYTPIPNINVSTILNYESRSSNILLRSYETRNIALTVQAYF